MCRRTFAVSFVRSFIPTAALAVIATTASVGFCQVQPAVEYKKLEIKLKSENFKEKQDAKREAIKAKDKADLAPIEDFYKEYLIPRLTQASAEAINSARKDILDDITSIEANKELSTQFNERFIKLMRTLVLKDNAGKSYSPATRINAAILLGRLNSAIPTKGNKEVAYPIPDAAVLPTLGAIIDPKEIDGLASSGMSTLARHLKFGNVNDTFRKAFVAKLKPYLELPASPSRSSDAQDYMIGQAIECLTLIARVEPDKDTAKQAIESLTPVLVNIISSERSEWLMENALLSLGAINPPQLSPEDLEKVEQGIAKFIKRSIKDWRKRINSSTSSSGGMGMGGGKGMGMGMGMGGMPGGDEGGPGGGGPGGAAGGGPSAGGAKKEAAPKEVLNARRIAHQRFERIHFALNGLYRKSPAGDPAAAAPNAPKGLLGLISDEEQKLAFTTLVEKIEKFQSELNDDKIKDLNMLVMAVRKSTKELRAAYEPLLGDDKSKADEPDEDEPADEEEF